MSKTDTGAGRSPLPLNSIRVFVAAARQLSFSRAALTLGMTQSGVSHHVRALENHLGASLFARIGSSIELSDAGRQYFETVQEAVATIELSTRQFSRRRIGSGRLLVRTSLPTLATTFLIPMLPDFRASPAVSVEVVTSLSPPAFDDVYDVLLTRDLALGDEEHWLLATEELACVAAPVLHREFSAKPMDGWPFLATRSRPDVLPVWLNQQTMRQAIAAPGVRVIATFEHYFLALPAAISGMGYLVIPRLLAMESLRQGHLMEAVTPAVRGSGSYKAYINPRTTEPEAAKAFCRWLKGLFRLD